MFGDDLAQKRLYLTGESYAGMYIPSIARGIHLRNKKLPSSSSLRHINLSGAAIGNGWIVSKEFFMVLLPSSDIHKNLHLLLLL